MKTNSTTLTYLNLLGDVYNNGSTTSPRGQEIKEKINTNITIMDPKELAFDLYGRDFNWKYLASELVWYLSGDLSAEKISKYASLWNTIKDQEGNVNSNYGYICFYRKVPEGCSQYDFAYKELYKDKDSRQSIIRYNSDEHAYSKNRDKPCTLSNQFFIRDMKLHMIVTMRSNDLFYGFPYDLVWFGLLQQSMFQDLKETYTKLELGELHWNNGSSHIYEPMFKKTEKILDNSNMAKYYFLTLSSSLKNIVKNITEDPDKYWRDLKYCKGQYKEFLKSELGIDVK